MCYRSESGFASPSITLGGTKDGLPWPTQVGTKSDILDVHFSDLNEEKRAQTGAFYAIFSFHSRGDREIFDRNSSRYSYPALFRARSSGYLQGGCHWEVRKTRQVGRRGGYFECTNFPDEILALIYKMVRMNDYRCIARQLIVILSRSQLGFARQSPVRLVSIPWSDHQNLVLLPTIFGRRKRTRRMQPSPLARK